MSEQSDYTTNSKPAKGKRFADPNKRGNTRGNSINGRANKDRRREEAFAREAAYKRLSLEEKLKRLPIDGAKRQRARLEAAIAERDAKAAEAKKVQNKQEKNAKKAVTTAGKV